MSFNVPADKIGKNVNVALRYPLPARDERGNVTISFTGFSGMLRADLPGAVMLMRGSKEILVPKDVIQEIVFDADVMPATSADVIKLIK